MNRRSAAASIAILVAIIVVQAVFLVGMRPEPDAPHLEIGPPTEVEGIVRIASLEGAVLLQGPLGEREAAVGDRPGPGETLRTAAGAHCILAVERHGEILLGGDGEILFERAPRRVDGVEILLKRGNAFVSFASPEFRDLADTGRVTIHTPHLSANPLRAEPTEFLLTVE